MPIKVVLKEGSDNFELELYSDGELYKPVRTGTPTQLGKRYVCAQPLERKEGDRTIGIAYRSGIVEIDGYNVYLGCGTEALATKAGSGMPYCCGMPMAQKEQTIQPSSD